MAYYLRRLCLLTGIACIAIGVFHLVLGVASVPGETHAGATVDSGSRSSPSGLGPPPCGARKACGYRPT